MKKQAKKIELKKATITQLNQQTRDHIKGGTDTFFACFTRGDCTRAGTGVLCY